jgi:hypothetical protein
MDEKVCKDLTYVCIKIAQGYLQKCITWPKRFGNGRQEWNKACVEYILMKRRQVILIWYIVTMKKIYVAIFVISFNY